jgi:hypothetical protein
MKLTYQLNSTYCDAIRQKYIEFINEMENEASKSTQNIGDLWLMGDGVSVIDGGCLTYEARYKPYDRKR